MVFGKSRGQLTAVGVVMVFVSLVVLAAFVPAITTVISDAALTGAAKTVADLIPFFFFVVIILSLLAYGTPQRQQYG